MTSPRREALVACLEAAQRDGIAPALAAAVRRGGVLVHASRHGDAQRVPQRRPLGPADLFDVASLTKVMATTSLAALLVDAGALDLDAPARRWVPELPRHEADVTIRHLLAHASGLPAWRPLHQRARGAQAVLEAACAAPLEARPGARAVYSDLGFIVLGAAVERCGGAALDAAFDARVAAPLALRSTFYLRPGSREAAARRGAHGFAAARRDEARGGVIAGVVDDDNAFAMGGVAGHAGLFSSAEDVALLGQAWLDALAGRSRWLSAGAAARFAARDATPGSERALGWDTPSPQGSALGDRLGRGPRGAIGHLGFTGCSLWLDLDQGVVCALLTNHVHPDGPDKPRLRAFRARFHDAVAEELGV